MAYIDQIKGNSPLGVPAVIPLGGTSFITTTPLAAGASVNSGWIDTQGYTTAFTLFFSDQASATNGLVLEISTNASTVLDTASVTYSTVNDFRRSAFTPSARYFRYTYTNGATPQTKFVFALQLWNGPLSPTMQNVVSALSSTSFAYVTKSVLELQDGASAFLPIYRTGNSMNVNVSNFPASQPVSLSSIPLPTGASTSANQATANTSLNNIDTDLGAATDTAVTDPTASGSVIAILKGLLSESVAQATTGTRTTYTLVTNTVQTIAANPNRKGCIIGSPSGAIFVGIGGTTLTTTSFDYKLAANGWVELPKEAAGLAVKLLSASSNTVTVNELV